MEHLAAGGVSGALAYLQTPVSAATASPEIAHFDLTRLLRLVKLGHETGLVFSLAASTARRPSSGYEAFLPAISGKGGCRCRFWVDSTSVPARPPHRGQDGPQMLSRSGLSLLHNAGSTGLQGAWTGPQSRAPSPASSVGGNVGGSSPHSRVAEPRIPRNRVQPRRDAAGCRSRHDSGWRRRSEVAGRWRLGRQSEPRQLRTPAFGFVAPMVTCRSRSLLDIKVEDTISTAAAMPTRTSQLLAGGGVLRSGAPMGSAHVAVGHPPIIERPEPGNAHSCVDLQATHAECGQPPRVQPGGHVPGRVQQRAAAGLPVV